MSIAISKLSRDDATRFHDLLRIYQNSIEISEQKPPEAIAELLAGDRHDFLIAADEGQVVGFAMVFFPVGVDCWLLDYMATDSKHRSSGVGAALFAAAVDAAQRRVGSAVGLIELDKPIHGTTAFGDALRRQRFYARRGCRRIAGLDYVLPQIGAGTPPPMELLAYPPAHVAALNKDVMRTWLAALYSQLYSYRADDVRISRMLQALPSELSLEQIA